MLAERVIRLLGQPGTPGAFYRGMRTMALDGFVLDVADTPGQRARLRPPRQWPGPGAFPRLRLLVLCETGSHVLWRWLLKPLRHGEVKMAPYLLRFLEKDMLPCGTATSRNHATLSAVLQRRAHLVARISSNRIFAPIQALPDGSYLAKLYRTSADRRRDRDRDGIAVRIIEYTLDDPGRPSQGERQRLLTTLLDAELDPATTWSFSTTNAGRRN